MMTNYTEKYVMRNGMTAEANWNGERWVPAVDDNDGFWASMYGVA